MMMKKITVGQRLYASVMTVFLLFAISFIVFQQYREKQYKIDTLNLKLQEYNDRMAEAMRSCPGAGEAWLTRYVERHPVRGIRVTLITVHGRVVYDNVRKDYAHMGNHADREEVVEALRLGHGSAVDRMSPTMKRDYFYSATYFPHQGYVVRSALPYDNDLADSLAADQHYIWFAIVSIILITVILFKFLNRLGHNITNLRQFALLADRNEPLDVEELMHFSNDELGEIAERIIKLYRQLQNTRQEQDRLKRQLTQNVAHELKTPVASIQGYLETILNNPKIEEATKEQFLKRCYAQSERLSALLRDISLLNRLDDAPVQKSRESVDVVSLVAEIQKEVSLQLEEHDMLMVVSLPEDLMVEGNHSLLYSVFRNLVDNSIAYAGIGTTIEISAELVTRSEGPSLWHFTFSDNGQGVEPHHLSRLFERFYRVDKGRSRKMGGTGLGLAIVKNAILEHGGTIDVRNNPEGGLRFDFTLPVA
jgi:signal transduction histidine kinase